MFRASIRRPVSAGLRSSTFTLTRAVADKQSHEYQSTRSFVRISDWDKSALGEPESWFVYQPMFDRNSQSSPYIGAQSGKRVQVVDVGHMSRASNRFNTSARSWLLECMDRFDSTGVRLLPRKHTDKTGGEISELTTFKHDLENAAVARLSCERIFRTGFLQEYVEARKLCAELKDERYHVIYHSLEKQAHLTYLLGRVELERAGEHHKFAWYMLSIAAGLGQLDAALLLHNLERFDASYTVYAEQRAVITTAALQMLDWRAIVAHCDHLFVESRRGKQSNIRPEDLEQCLDMLEAAMSLTSPTKEEIVDREAPADRVDVDMLERFIPPYQMLLAFTSAEIAAGNKSERMIELYEKAARDGGLVYNDPAAAWAYVSTVLQLDKECDDDWLQCAKLAATNGNSDACFQLARHHFYTERWHPSTASEVLTEKGGETTHRSEDEELAIHNEIMARKKKSQIKLQAGTFWMEMCAQLNINDAARMLNRYCIAAFLLRQNGFMDEGKAVLIRAKEEFKNCVDNAAVVRKATTRLDEYLEYWDKKLVHQLLGPKMIGDLLDEAHKF